MKKIWGFCNRISIQSIFENNPYHEAHEDHEASLECKITFVFFVCFVVKIS